MRYWLVGLGVLIVMTFLWAAERASQNEWSPERITASLKAVEKLHSQGLMSDAHYRRKEAMFEARRRGTFKSTALATRETGEVNLIQNGGFEEINRNTAPNRSRWLWWSGWSWGGDYQNFWATAPNVRSGKYAAGIRCKGNPGRIGIFTPPIPILEGTNEYQFSVWGKGEGDNQLFINFEGGCRGSLRQKVPSEWTELKVTGRAEAKAKEFGVYIYATGGGTIYLDDARLVPAGVPTES